MKKLYITPSLRVHRLLEETQILAGSTEVTGAQSELTDNKVDINLDNNEYDPTKPGTDFIEVE